jgi:hypothetical protein
MIFNEDSMPCLCDCGEWFDLNDGNPCSDCNKVLCKKCINEPFDPCPTCKEQE